MKVRVIYTILLLAFFHKSNSQNQIIDSLNYSFTTAKTDSAKMYILNELGWQYLSTANYEKALSSSIKSLEISNKSKNRSGKLGALNNLGTIYAYLSDFPKALSYYKQSLKLVEQKGDKKGMAGLYNNMGIIYKFEKEYLLSLEYYQKSIKIYEILNDESGIAQTNLNVGVIYFFLKQYEKSIAYLESTKKYYEKKQDDDGIYLCLDNISNSLLALNKLDELFKVSERTLSHARTTKKPLQLISALQIRGDYYLKMKKFKEAIIAYSESYNYALDVKSLNNQKGALSGLYEAYKNLKDYRLALKYHEIYKSVIDSMFNEQKNEEINNLKTEIALDRQEFSLTEKAKIEKEKLELIAKKEKENQEAIKSRQQLIIYSVAGFLLLTLIFSFFLYKRFRITSRQKSIIEIQKSQIEIQRDLVAEKQKEIVDSISYAKRLQEAILPSERAWMKCFPESFIYYQPKDIVAGDFYFLEKKNNKIIFAVADCTGHGVPGAMVSVVCSNALKRAVNEFHTLYAGDILNKVRELVIETFSAHENLRQEHEKFNHVRDGMDISLGVLDESTLNLDWAGANNPLWIIKKNSLTAFDTNNVQEDEVELRGQLNLKKILEIKPEKQPIGIYESAVPFVSKNIQLEKGDLIYLFSDGFADQFGGDKGKKFKISSLNKLILENSALACNDQKNKLENTFREWTNQYKPDKTHFEQTDDICIIGIKL